MRICFVIAWPKAIVAVYFCRKRTLAILANAEHHAKAHVSLARIFRKYIRKTHNEAHCSIHTTTTTTMTPPRTFIRDARDMFACATVQREREREMERIGAGGWKGGVDLRVWTIYI